MLFLDPRSVTDFVLCRLHHSNVDRLLFLFQASTGTYIGTSNYIPFPNSAACGENIGRCGYSYDDTSGRSTFSQRLSSMFLQNGSSRRLLDIEDPMTTGGDPQSPQARAYLSRYLQDLNAGYQGYSWRLVLNDFNPNVLKNRTYGLHVLIKGSSDVQLPMVDDSTVDPSAMRLLPNYCGSYSGFNTFMPEMARDRVSADSVRTSVQQQQLSY